MVNIIVEISKYLLIFLIALYTFHCFTVFARHTEEKQQKILRRQNKIMYMLHFVAYLVITLKTGNIAVIVFYAAQLIFFIVTINAYRAFYPKVSRLVVNNMCMLLCIGFIIQSRINFEKSVRQFFIVVVAMGVTMFIPFIIRKLLILDRLTYVYAAVGILALAAVAARNIVTYGAKLSFNIGGIAVQPSEFVKIIFIFCIAAMLTKSTSFRQVVITTAIAGAHVLILVVSKDLGAALIYFVVYLLMLYVATRNNFYLLGGLAGGSVAAVLAYKLFSHVQVRVAIWQDPFKTYNEGGYQVAQSLFAIGTGGWFGMGLCQGSPNKVPVVLKDFIFAAVVEEMGAIFGLCLILICLSCFIMFLNIAMQIRNRFYKLIALGLGISYIFQIFLTVGGATKFIPLTGVTLPLVSYGGSSVLSTLILFAIIQGLYILREDEDDNLERQRLKEQKKSKRRAKKEAGRTGTAGGSQTGSRNRAVYEEEPAKSPAQLRAEAARKKAGGKTAKKR